MSTLGLELIIALSMTDEEFKNLSPHEKEIFTQGRVSVLKDFDNMCCADAFIGFTAPEWEAIKKFFAFNKALAGDNAW